MLLRYCVPSMNQIVSKTVAGTTGSLAFSPAVFISLQSQVTVFILSVKSPLPFF